ncbi:hypothetical protein Hanom_Chr08g00731211 [Helianthus anomalus]
MKGIGRITELEKKVDEQQTQNKTLELLSRDLGDDCKWRLTRGVPLVYSSHLVISFCSLYSRFTSCLSL